MHLTDYHAKYFAHELTKRCPSDSTEKLAGTLVDAQDEIDRQRERLIAEIESKLQQRTSLTELFRVRWKLE
jgi:adenine-specific DNA-methyltransferase